MRCFQDLIDVPYESSQELRGTGAADGSGRGGGGGGVEPKRR